jgi:hypothetical protein
MDWEKLGLTEAIHMIQVCQGCISKILHMMTNEQLIRPENWNWTLSLSTWKPLELAAHKDLLLLITKLVSTTFFFVKSP